MTDTSPASPLATTPAPAAGSAPPVATDLLQPPTAMTIEQATAKKSELFATKGLCRTCCAGRS